MINWTNYIFKRLLGSENINKYTNSVKFCQHATNLTQRKVLLDEPKDFTPSPSTLISIHPDLSFSALIISSSLAEG